MHNRRNGWTLNDVTYLLLANEQEIVLKSKLPGNMKTVTKNEFKVQGKQYVLII